MVTLDQAGLNRTAVVVLPAPVSLRDVVELLWIDERPRLSAPREPWRVVADDAPHVIYCRYTDRRAQTDGHRLNIVGARARFVDIDCSRRLFTVGARLKPGALPALFHVPAHELTNCSVAAGRLADKPAREALARMDTDSPVDAARHLMTFIEDAVAHGRPLDDRARSVSARDASTPGTVDSVAHSLGIGDRALRYWSATHIGLGLKRFLSIRRLHRALHARLEQPAATWSRIAAATGFADQPHLVRDCRTLLGESPGEFFARAS